VVTNASDERIASIFRENSRRKRCVSAKREAQDHMVFQHRPPPTSTAVRTSNHRKQRNVITSALCLFVCFVLSNSIAEQAVLAVPCMLRDRFISRPQHRRFTRFLWDLSATTGKCWNCTFKQAKASILHVSCLSFITMERKLKKIVLMNFGFVLCFSPKRNTPF
jgi:hypothetical protein